MRDRAALVRDSHWILIVAAIVVNVAVGYVTQNVLGLPLYLDSFGTILVGALLGPLAGAATGAASNLLWGLILRDPTIVPFAVTAAAIGWAAGFAASLGAFRNLGWLILSGLLTGVMAVLISAPIAAYVFGGVTDSGTDQLVSFLQATGANMLQAATLQGFISDPLDKMLSYLVVWPLWRWLSPRYLSKREGGADPFRLFSGYGGAVLLSALAAAVAWIFVPAFGLSSSAVFYVAVIVAAWRGGLGPAIVTMALSALVFVALLVSPQTSPGLPVDEVLVVLAFLSVSVVTALITYAREKALRELNESLAAQRHSEARIRAMTDSVAEALVLISLDREILDVNQRFEELFGIPPGRVLGQSFADLQPLVRQVFADPERFAALVAEALDSEHGEFKELLVQNWPKPRELELFSSAVVEEGEEPHEHYGRLLVFRDVTHEREVDRMKTEFVSLVSHELRTPLTSIKGFTDMVLDGDAGEVNEDVQEFLGIVKANVDRLVALVNDLLDISRIESGRIKLDIKPLDLEPLVAEVVTVMSHLIEEKGQSLAVDISPEARWIQGDRDKIVQVLTTDVSNAFKYTPAGGAIRIDIARENDFCRVAVIDNGIGIAPEDQEQLFTRFYRVDSSLTAEIGGTGLGLSIVKSIIELHGGWVGVRSKPGSGSTFYFTVPLAAEVPQVPAPKEREVAAPKRQTPVRAVVREAQEPGRVRASGQTILVIEDDPQISRLVSASLEKAGYLVREATGAEDLLERIAREPPDLITLDIERLGADGYEWVEQLAASPVTRDIPILIITVFDRDLQDPQFAVSALPKPVDREQLLQMVAQLLVESARQRVLVVEDDASTRELLSAALEKRGFEVLLAEDGAAGLAAAKKEHPDLILLDLRLPGMDGLAVLQALKQETAAASIPVITMTGSEGLNEGTRARVLSLGASDFVTKPFDLDMLIQEILVFVQQEDV